MTEPDVAEQEINLLELAQVIAKRKMVIIRVCGMIAILAVIVTLLLPDIYTATARVIPPLKDSGGGLSALLGQIGGTSKMAELAGGSLGFGGSTDLYLGILKSRSVADAVIKRLDLAKEFKTRTPEETRKKLGKVLNIKAGKDGIITISADNKNPKMAAQLANAMVEELDRKSVLLNLTKAGTERIFLEKRLDLVKQDLKKAETDLKSFQELHKTFKVDAQATAAIQGIARINAEIASKEVQLATLQGFQTDESPEVRMAKSSLAKLRSQYAAMAGSSGEDNVIPASGNIPALALEHLRLMREIKIEEAVFEQLTKQFELAKFGEAKDSSSLQVLDEAVVPLKKSKPFRLLIVIIATVIAFFMSILWVFIQEYFENLPDEDKARWQSIRDSLAIDRKKRAI
jgi:uncharacterized protein involved in exopolysaccharide biosynthesis